MAVCAEGNSCQFGGIVLPKKSGKKIDCKAIPYGIDAIWDKLTPYPDMLHGDMEKILSVIRAIISENKENS